MLPAPCLVLLGDGALRSYRAARPDGDVSSETGLLVCTRPWPAIGIHAPLLPIFLLRQRRAALLPRGEAGRRRLIRDWAARVLSALAGDGAHRLGPSIYVRLRVMAWQPRCLRRSLLPTLHGGWCCGARVFAGRPRAALGRRLGLGYRAPARAHARRRRRR